MFTAVLAYTTTLHRRRCGNGARLGSGLFVLSILIECYSTLRSVDTSGYQSDAINVITVTVGDISILDVLSFVQGFNRKLTTA